MPRKITDPLTQGMPSKIYFIAYGGPISGYKIAKKIQGLKGRAKLPQTAKIYNWLEKFEEMGIVKKVEGGWISQPQPLLTEIERRFKVKFEHFSKILSKLELEGEAKAEPDLSEFERHVLLTLLDSEVFRSFVYFISQDFDFKGDLNAINLMLNQLGIIFFQITEIKRIHSPEEHGLRDPSTKEEFDAAWGQVQELLASENFRKELEKDFLELYPRVMAQNIFQIPLSHFMAQIPLSDLITIKQGQVEEYAKRALPLYMTLLIIPIYICKKMTLLHPITEYLDEKIFESIIKLIKKYGQEKAFC
jgi:hypothetical protein